VFSGLRLSNHTATWTAFLLALIIDLKSRGMSLLMYFLASDAVTIFTDTLATKDAGMSRRFTSKCWGFPHMGLCVAMTGSAPIAHRWISTLNEVTMWRDIEDLNVAAPEALRQVVRDLIAEGEPIGGTTTAYHFGLPERSSEYVGYAYRSAKDFVSDKLVNGFGVKPPPDEDWPETPTTLEEIIELAKRIKAEQDSRDPDIRLFIGGELVCVAMVNAAWNIVRVHRFDDYDDVPTPVTP
jgi:hypothetical protein